MRHWTILPDEVEITAIRAQGAGGQNVNKVSSAIHLRFNVASSSLPEDIKARLLELRDHRITRDGVVVIKAQESRSQEQNRRIRAAGRTDRQCQRGAARARGHPSDSRLTFAPLGRQNAAQ